MLFFGYCCCCFCFVAAVVVVNVAVFVFVVAVLLALVLFLLLFFIVLIFTIFRAYLLFLFVLLCECTVSAEELSAVQRGGVKEVERMGGLGVVYYMTWFRILRCPVSRLLAVRTSSTFGVAMVTPVGG